MEDCRFSHTGMSLACVDGCSSACCPSPTHPPGRYPSAGALTHLDQVSPWPDESHVNPGGAAQSKHSVSDEGRGANGGGRGAPLGLILFPCRLMIIGRWSAALWRQDCRVEGRQVHHRRDRAEAAVQERL